MHSLLSYLSCENSPQDLLTEVTLGLSGDMMDDVQIESLVRRIVSVEAREIVREELNRVTADSQAREAKTWKAISDLQTITTRLETVVHYHEDRQKDTEGAHRKTQQEINHMKVVQAREAGKMGAIAGITSSVIVAIIIQLALAVFHVS